MLENAERITKVVAIFPRPHRPSREKMVGLGLTETKGNQAGNAILSSDWWTDWTRFFLHVILQN